MPGRNSQVARIYCLLDVLEQTTSGLTVAELHAKALERGHEAGKRTIYRDLEALSQAGFPLFPDQADENSQRWRLERKTKINQYFVLTARELFALFLARGALTPLQSTPFYEDLKSVFSKLEERLGSRQSDYFNSLGTELKFEPGPQWGLSLNPEILETIRSSCAEGHLLECTYYSSNSKKESVRKLGPHYLYYARGGLYLVAEDMSDQKVKVFALPRFKSAHMLADAYEGTIKTPEDLFDGSLGVFTAGTTQQVVIEFEPEVAEYVRERRWHPSQRVVSLEGGRVRVTLDVSDTPELHSWVLGFGPSAKIISPISLAEKVAIRAMETVKVYNRKIG